MSGFTRTALADRLAVGALLLAAVAAAAGLFVPDLYRDTEAWVRQARASDATTLAVAVPLLAIALWRARGGSTAARLVAWGVLGYLVYGYAIFAFAVETNPMTLLHYAILGLSTWSLLLGLMDLAAAQPPVQQQSRLPRRITGWFLVVTAALFALLWLGEIAASVSSGETAPSVAALGLVANPVWALDLAYALPFFAFAGVLMLRRHALGWVAPMPALVFVVVMGVSILVIFAFDAAAGAVVPLPPVLLIIAVVAMATVLAVLGVLPPTARWRPGLGRLGATAVALELLLALGAIGGGAALMLGPRGEILPLPVAALDGSPFSTYFVPGLILLTVLGIGPVVVAILAVRRDRFAPILTMLVGLALLAWLAVQIAIIGFAMNPPLQPIYLALGATITVIGLAWWLTTTRPGVGDAGSHAS